MSLRIGRLSSTIVIDPIGNVLLSEIRRGSSYTFKLNISGLPLSVEEKTGISFNGLSDDK